MNKAKYCLQKTAGVIQKFISFFMLIYGIAGVIPAFGYNVNPVLEFDSYIADIYFFLLVAISAVLMFFGNKLAPRMINDMDYTEIYKPEIGIATICLNGAYILSTLVFLLCSYTAWVLHFFIFCLFLQPSIAIIVLTSISLGLKQPKYTDRTF